MDQNRSLKDIIRFLDPSGDISDADISTITKDLKFTEVLDLISDVSSDNIDSARNILSNYNQRFSTGISKNTSNEQMTTEDGLPGIKTSNTAQPGPTPSANSLPNSVGNSAAASLRAGARSINTPADKTPAVGPGKTTTPASSIGAYGTYGATTNNVNTDPTKTSPTAPSNAVTSIPTATASAQPNTQHPMDANELLTNPKTANSSEAQQIRSLLQRLQK